METDVVQYAFDGVDPSVSLGAPAVAAASLWCDAHTLDQEAKFTSLLNTLVHNVRWTVGHAKNAEWEGDVARLRTPSIIIQLRLQQGFVLMRTWAKAFTTTAPPPRAVVRALWCTAAGMWARQAAAVQYINMQLDLLAPRARFQYAGGLAAALAAAPVESEEVKALRLACVRALHRGAIWEGVLRDVNQCARVQAATVVDTDEDDVPLPAALVTKRIHDATWCMLTSAEAAACVCASLAYPDTQLVGGIAYGLLALAADMVPTSTRTDWAPAVRAALNVALRHTLVGGGAPPSTTTMDAAAAVTRLEAVQEAMRTGAADAVPGKLLPLAALLCDRWSAARRGDPDTPLPVWMLPGTHASVGGVRTLWMLTLQAALAAGANAAYVARACDVDGYILMIKWAAYPSEQDDAEADAFLACVPPRHWLTSLHVLTRIAAGVSAFNATCANMVHEADTALAAALRACVAAPNWSLFDGSIPAHSDEDPAAAGGVWHVPDGSTPASPEILRSGDEKECSALFPLLLLPRACRASESVLADALQLKDGLLPADVTHLMRAACSVRGAVRPQLARIWANARLAPWSLLNGGYDGAPTRRTTLLAATVASAQADAVEEMLYRSKQARLKLQRRVALPDDSGDAATLGELTLSPLGTLLAAVAGILSRCPLATAAAEDPDTLDHIGQLLLQTPAAHAAGLDTVDDEDKEALLAMATVHGGTELDAAADVRCLPSEAWAQMDALDDWIADTLPRWQPAPPPVTASAAASEAEEEEEEDSDEIPYQYSTDEDVDYS